MLVYCGMGTMGDTKCDLLMKVHVKEGNNFCDL